jgi:hypothetical protein
LRQCSSQSKPIWKQQSGQQVRAVELAIASEDYLARVANPLLYLLKQLTVLILRQVPFLALDDQPVQRQGAFVVDHAHHQSYAHAPLAARPSQA